MEVTPIWWIGFNAVVLVLLVLDMTVFHKKAHEVKPKEAAWWSLFWVVLSLAFNYLIYHHFGSKPGIEFLTGYLIEKSLSVDNLFVFVLIFSYFNVPAEYQHRVLFWGIIGALVMRAVLIFLGAWLISSFSWIIYVFGAFLLYTGIRMALEKESSVEVEANPMIKLLKRWFPVTNRYHGQSLFVMENGVRYMTPLFIVLVMVETTDVIFALDSIPAIFAITKDEYIVYTSNICAILGLRALYFLLANVINKFHLLKYGLSIVLSYIGVKMLVTFFDIHINTVLSLCIVGFVLTASIVLSLIFPLKDPEDAIVEHDPLNPPTPIAPYDAEQEAIDGLREREKRE